MQKSNGAIERILLDDQTIKERVEELAKEISVEYKNIESVVLVGILKGSFIFLADLARRLSIPHRIDFMAVSSYENNVTSSGVVRIMLDLRRSIINQHVIIVEDIVDTGLTLRYLIDNLRSRQAASVKTCVLLSKPARREVDVHIDYLGFEIPDEWVVGYGLDYAEQYRTLPYIGVLSPAVYGK